LIKNRTAAERGEKPLAKSGATGKIVGSQPTRILFSFTKTGIFRYLGHLDLVTLLVRLGRIAGISFQYSGGYNPKPRISLPFPLPLGIASRYELGEVTLEGRIGGEEFKRMMNRRAENGLGILSAEQNNRKKSIASETYFHDYIVHWKEGVQRKKIAESLRDIGPQQGKDAAPEASYKVRDEGLFVRLEGSRSVKSLFPPSGEMSYVNHDIERVMIWRKADDRLEPFLP
jgi:hypothetical protein